MEKVEWEKANAITDGITFYCRECLIKQAENEKEDGETVDDYLCNATWGWDSVFIEDNFVCDSCEN
jgi:hypothetical protein